jgi:hypothetical protein
MLNYRAKNQSPKKEMNTTDITLRKYTRHVSPLNFVQYYQHIKIFPVDVELHGPENIWSGPCKGGGGAPGALPPGLASKGPPQVKESPQVKGTLLNFRSNM